MEQFFYKFSQNICNHLTINGIFQFSNHKSMASSKMPWQAKFKAHFHKKYKLSIPQPTDAFDEIW